MIFVTAAGGGIRAAYWSAAVLGRLQDCVPNFQKKIFSLSGVSGGSLGVGTFATLMAAPPRKRDGRLKCEHPVAWEAAPVGMGYHQSFLREVLSDDFLAPVIREMLLGDMFRALLPWTVSQSNRAVALEIAWERSWQLVCERTFGPEECKRRIGLESAFSLLEDKNLAIPRLFLNGVHQETGKRLITSTSVINGSQIIDAIDFFDFVKHDVRISTAILNSARFPIVSPSGALIRYDENSSTLVGHVIDGGYFDNNGTLTSNEVSSIALERLNALRHSSDKCEGEKRRRVVFLEILNDTSMPEQDSVRDGDDFSTDADNDPRTYQALDMNLPARQLLTAIQGLDSARSARAVHASKTLAKFASAETCNKRFVQLKLCSGMIPDPPLGWTLSRESRDSIDALILGHGSQLEKYRTSKSYSNVRDCYQEIQNRLDQLISFLN